ncbi:nicotinate-nucleotide--dimethylbenzimidazole phosphoribosyltransferase [Pseudaminobacter sp. 19-2017]|uniref:Nicotinate-nucleotide--dimethylbenzimidazole phosphoribosyltransferase n=1 Tax=Pseudaminobacter soli (ex Zhang et al. 2022) TaxID=2831468 RepID=A0A942I6C0_9HYPH|nr:nicotinate-nucleotide--dimethylbenzimidazole phosphoribosyltransferase [Pseudaminobacter soli]MBS3647150.1 nicotinate-nucleotide--dimethylbenzimidazole phosphoribosyltransferase [Pseudaminobacter soli]
MVSGLPFDDIRGLLRALPAGDEVAAGNVAAIFSAAKRQSGSLGRLEEIAVWLARWSGRAPAVRRPLAAIFAGNHGVATHGVSPRAVEETARAVELCAAGGAPINGVCLAYDIGLKVFDLALHLPTADITTDAALDERGCAATIAFGMEAVAGGTDLLCIGHFGVGSSTVAAAMFAALFGGTGKDWVGPGSGTDVAMIARKAEIVDRALSTHRGQLGDPLEVLRRLGGREFAAIAGAIIAARTEHIPVILDGAAAIAAAAVLRGVNPDAVSHCMVAQRPVDPGTADAVSRLGLSPLLGVAIASGDGTAAALAAGIVKAAASVATTLAEWRPVTT